MPANDPEGRKKEGPSWVCGGAEMNLQLVTLAELLFGNIPHGMAKWGLTFGNGDLTTQVTVLLQLIKSHFL